MMGNVLLSQDRSLKQVKARAPESNEQNGTPILTGVQKPSTSHSSFTEESVAQANEKLKTQEAPKQKTVTLTWRGPPPPSSTQGLTDS